MGRSKQILFLSAGYVLCCAILALFIASADRRAETGGSAPSVRRAPSLTNPLGNPPGAVDGLIFIDTAQWWQRGVFERTSAEALPTPRIVLNDTRARGYPRRGRWTSPEVPTEFAFTELIPSWNASLPDGTGMRVDVRVRNAATGAWSPWLYMGSWGRTPKSEARAVSFEHGVVNVDNLTLDQPASAWQARIALFSYELNEVTAPAVRRLAISYSGTMRDERLRARLALGGRSASGWARDLRVPFRTQLDAPSAIRGSICSPTCVSMVMAYHGIDRPVLENARAIYDDESGIFGNWARAVQRAAELGLDGWLARFRNWDQVKAMIAENQPVIAAIRFERGAFPSAILSATDGHLIVIRGFTPEGDVIVNDPAGRERGDGAIYKAEELARAWFDRGGLGYVIRRPDGALIAAESAGSPSQRAAED